MAFGKRIFVFMNFFHLFFHFFLFSTIFDLFDATWLSMRWNCSSNNKMSWDHKLKNSIGSHFIRMSIEHGCLGLERQIWNAIKWKLSRNVTHKRKKLNKKNTKLALEFEEDHFWRNLLGSMFLCSTVMNDGLPSGMGLEKVRVAYINHMVLNCTDVYY